MNIKLKIIIYIVTILTLLLIIWIAWGNKALELNKYSIYSNKLPNEFNGYRIVHVSDLHNAEIDKKTKSFLT